MGEVVAVVFLLGGWTLAPKRNLKFGMKKKFFFFFSFFFQRFFFFLFFSFFLLLFFLSVRLSSLSDVVFTGGRQSRVFLRGI